MSKLSSLLTLCQRTSFDGSRLKPTFDIANAFSLRSVAPVSVLNIGKIAILDCFDLRAGFAIPSFEHTRQLIHFILDALGGRSRLARYQTDVVASWVSMCGIQYNYRKDDTFAALQKALRALRLELNMCIVNFHVNTYDIAVDTSFLEHATSHVQCHAENKDYFFGLPIETGRTDTAIHFREAIMCRSNNDLNAVSQDVAAKVELQRATGGKIDTSSDLRNFQEVINTISPAVTGTEYVEGRLDGLRTSFDVRYWIYSILYKADPSDLAGKKLHCVVVPCEILRVKER